MRNIAVRPDSLDLDILGNTYRIADAARAPAAEESVTAVEITFGQGIVTAVVDQQGLHELSAAVGVEVHYAGIAAAHAEYEEHIQCAGILFDISARHGRIDVIIEADVDISHVVREEITALGREGYEERVGLGIRYFFGARQHHPLLCHIVPQKDRAVILLVEGVDAERPERDLARDRRAASGELSLGQHGRTRLGDVGLAREGGEGHGPYEHYQSQGYAQYRPFHNKIPRFE